MSGMSGVGYDDDDDGVDDELEDEDADMDGMDSDMAGYQVNDEDNIDDEIDDADDDVIEESTGQRVVEDVIDIEEDGYHKIESQLEQRESERQSFKKSSSI